MKNRSDCEAAAREAYEEAGLNGIVADAPIGAFTYFKRLKSGQERQLVVDVFPLKVTDQTMDWPEKGQRELAWMTPFQAAGSVQEPGLRAILSSFCGSRPRAS